MPESRTMRRIFTIALLGAILTGCTSTGGVKQEAAPVPAWVLNPPRDTAAALYGVGEGSSRDIAKSTALKDVAAKLRVTISGQLENQVSVRNEQVDRQALSRVSEVVQKTEFSQYSIEQTAPGGNGFYVLVKVDRQAFIREVKGRLDSLDAGIRRHSGQLKDQSPIERFVSLQKMKPQLEQATAQAQLLVAVGGNEGTEARIADYRRLQQDAATASSQLVFRLRASSQDADLASAIGAFINDSGMRASQGNGAHANDLTIRSQSKTDQIYGSKLVKLTVDLTIQDDRGQALASKQYTVSGTSRYDFAAARQSAIQKLSESLREAGPIAGLGF